MWFNVFEFDFFLSAVGWVDDFFFEAFLFPEDFSTVCLYVVCTLLYDNIVMRFNWLQ